MNIIAEIYQFLFISSIIFVIYILFDMIIKMYGRFIQKNDSIRYVMTTPRKIIFWLSISLILSYLIV
jgi:hypothetical protein